MELAKLIKPIKNLPSGEDAKFCDFIQDCVCRGNKLCLKGYSIHCQVKRFYERYGTEPLGVGSKL